MSDAIYLVGVAPAAALDGFEHAGIEPGTAARLLPVAGGLSALIVDVPLETFTGEAAEERLKDVRWLTPRAEQHEAIVRAARGWGGGVSLMPAGFGSVFSSVESLAETIAGLAPDIRAFFRETDGCDEWSLKCWASRSDAVERARTRLRGAHPTGGGAAYLRSRKLAADAEREAEEHALGLIEGLVEDLGEVIAGAVERRTVADAEDRDAWLLAHIALLVDRRAQTQFDDRLDALAEGLEAEAVRLELTGPWAPYSFCPQFEAGADDDGAMEAA